MRWLVVAWLVLGSTIARADEYPSRLIDRPVVIPDGMTEAELGFDSRRTPSARLFDVTSMGASIGHAFGALDPFVGTSVYVTRTDGSQAAVWRWVDVGASYALGRHAAITVAGYVVTPTDDLFRAYELAADVATKRVYDPFAIYLQGGVFVTRVTELHGTLSPGVYLFARGEQTGAFGRALLETQLGSSLAITVSATARTPIIARRVTEASEAVDLAVGVLYALGRYDLHASASALDITGDADPSVGASVAARF
jgi:hypothetical protein